MAGMKLSGFTFVRNAVLLDYPVVESISSILPIVDEFIVNVGPSDDETLELLRAVGNPKIKIIQSQWNPHLVSGGYICAQQTNIALFNCMGKWAFYLQPDEVVHEDDHPLIMEYVDRYVDDDRVEGLTLRELSFWGDCQTVIRVYPQWMRRRCWIVKPHHFTLSRGDAAGFTVHPKYKERGRRIRVIDTGARLFHVGAVKSEEALRYKCRTFSAVFKGIRSSTYEWEEAYDYSKQPRRFVARYQGTYPKVLEPWIRKHPRKLDLESPQWRTALTWKERWRLVQTFWSQHVSDRYPVRSSFRLLRG
jgi:glycosyltransferase involved in cell wall biosynthesis